MASRISYDPRRLQGVTLYRETERAFSKGERVQFTAPNRERHIANRELGTIERIEKNGNLQLRMDSGRRVTFNLKENRLTPLEKASKTVLKSRSCKPPIFQLDIPYKYLYNLTMTSKGSKTRIKWEGDSNEEIRSWPDDVRANIGLELHRLDNHEEPLDSKSMGKSLPGVRELRDEDKDFWYRLLYWLHSGWIYVVHCFKKKTNQTSKGDIDKAKDRLKTIRARKDEPFVEEEEESA